MGVVYEADDVERRSPVALKMLSNLEADGVYRLKLEFRSLADVIHPNLCRIHELFSDNGWFFTMELVRGERFDQWVRPKGRLDEPRLRHALDQLCAAVQAIHGAGKLHRDLKPSNVLATPEGRVVVLDFGLAADRAEGGVGQTVSDGTIVGTPAYMAPEQASGAPANQATDLYAVGSMLFEALTGRCPFVGTTGEILAAKQRDRAPSVAAWAPAAPPDLGALCAALLATNSAERPTLTAISKELARFTAGGTRAVALVRNAAHDAPHGSPVANDASTYIAEATRVQRLFVGREAECAALLAAYETTLAQGPVALFLEGESGLGKTTLVQSFLDDRRAEGYISVIAGRCYERENVPFKAFDAVIDDLSRYLRRLDRAEAGSLMPREVFALARLFPALERVPAVAQAPRRDLPDPQELQQRAFHAFGELLTRMRDRGPVVLAIDDLQWMDRDSCVFLEYLFGETDPTPILVLASHRSERADENTLLQRVKLAASRNPRLSHQHLRLGPLSTHACQSLAAHLLSPSTPEFAEVTADVALASQGSPFFVNVLVRYANLAGPRRQKFSLKDAVTEHIAMFEPCTRALLETLAVAGRPLPVRLALEASGAAHDALDHLAIERLLCVSATRSQQGDHAHVSDRNVECYHDKLREHVSATLAPERLRQIHGDLAAALEVHDGDNAEHLALHHHGAGHCDLAAKYYERAGDASTVALAFDHAARQYEQALVLAGTGSDPGLRVKFASALASAGSSVAAAAAYRDAAANSTREEALDHLRKAAHLLMTSGYIDAGRELLQEVLASVGLSLPRSRRRALASALLSRLRLRVRGLAVAPALDGGLPIEEERCLSALWTVVQGSVGNDPFVMVEMAAHHVRRSLDLGDKRHAARGLSLEAYLNSFPGPTARMRSEALLKQGETVAEGIDDPELKGWVLEMRGCVLVHEGRFAEARVVLRQALDWLQTRCSGVPFELACGRGYDLNAANHLGAFAEVADTASGMVENSLRRGDMYQACGVAGFAVQSWLAHRGLDYAKVRFEEARRLLQPQRDFQWIDYLMLVAELDIALYEGNPARGLALLAQRWPAMESSQLLRMEIALVMIHYCRGGLVLAALARTGAASRRAGGEVSRAPLRRAIRLLRASPLTHAQGWGEILAAGLALHDARPDLAEKALRKAAVRLDEARLQMYAAAARRSLGRLVGGEQGNSLVAAAEATMAGQGVVDYEATNRLLTPVAYFGT